MADDAVKAENHGPAVAIDTWHKVGALATVLVTGILAINTLFLAPLSARVERAEAALQQGDRDRADVLQRITAVEQILARIERKLDRDRGH